MADIGEALDSRFVFNQGDNDFTCNGRWLLADDDIIPFKDSRVHHGVAVDAKREEMTGHAVCIVGQIAFDLLDCEDGRSRLNTAKDGNAAFASKYGGGNGKGTGFTVILLDVSALLERFYVRMDRGWRFQVDRSADFTDGRRIAVRRGEFDDKIIDLLLLLGEFLHFEHSIPAVRCGTIEIL